jgi:hypothetical protein
VKKTIIGTAAALAIVGSFFAGASAEASSPTNTTSSTNTLVSAKCYHHAGSSTTMFHWDSKKGAYVAYPSPHHSTTDYIKCHK